MTRPKTFVIIVNYNSRKFIQPCLESLKKQSFRDFRLVVVDNASSDDSLKIIKQLTSSRVKGLDNSLINNSLIKNKSNVGFPAAANQGIKYALKNGAEYIILLGFDTRPDKNWLRELVNQAKKLTKAGIVQSKILLFPSGQVQSLGNRISWLGFGYPSAQPQKNLDYASGTSMLIKKEVFEKIGFLDEKLMFMEDLDFGWRARRAGFEIRFADNSVVGHQYEFLRYSQKYYYLERARKLVLLKNLGWGKLLLRLPLLAAAEIAIWGHSFLKGWFKDKIRAEIYFWQNLRP